VIGEEIGWRGFLQPRLRGQFGLAQAGIVTGAIYLLFAVAIAVRSSALETDRSMTAGATS
jgi:membrane protease YdiL (CAAX protease family)